MNPKNYSDGGKFRLPLKYKLPFYGRIYRVWSKFIHKHGYHYAPKQYPPEPRTAKAGLGGQPILEWYHWCHWCGLRGSTIDVTTNGNNMVGTDSKPSIGSEQPPKTKHNKNSIGGVDE